MVMRVTISDSLVHNQALSIASRLRLWNDSLLIFQGLILELRDFKASL